MTEDTPNKGPTPGQPVEAAGIPRGAEPFLDFEPAFDLASHIAVEIMACPWTHGPNEEEHAYRYGELQELIDKALKEHLLAPAPQPQPDLEAEAALREATSLAVSLFNQHYRFVDEEYVSGRVVWQPLENVRGVISQIDNMTTGLVRRAEPQPALAARVAELEERAEKAEADCQHWANDYAEQGKTLSAERQLRVAAEARLAAQPDALAGSRISLPPETAPHESKLVWLLVDYTGCESWLPLDDAEQAWTIGHRVDGEDAWQFVGWSWEQDRFCDASSPADGRVIGWAPIEKPGLNQKNGEPT